MSRGIFPILANSVARHFACPACHGALKPHAADSGDYGWLACRTCRRHYPVLNGFAHFSETLPAGDEADLASLQALERQLAGDPDAYRRFVDQARHRPSYEPYAAFAPFNEASRALYPLIPALRRHLAPGDLIVDVWCRTGWTGALLAGLFPEQRVVSLWEGPSGVLGYAGYRYWLGHEARAANWSIAFAEPRLGLPFADGSVALLHAADSVHRFDLEPFLGECLRVSGEEGALVFPHIHLANRDPEPFFERGGAIRHGSAYRQWLDDRLKPGRRSAYVLSERALFERVDNRPLADEAGTPDYNALIVILSDRHGPHEIARAQREHHEGDRLILNPLVAVDNSTGLAAYDSAALAGRAAYLLKRHPVYAQRLARQLPVVLTGDERRVLYWARLAPELSLGELGARAGLAAPLLAETVRRLDAQEIIHAAPVNAAVARLQRFYSTRQNASPLSEQQFATLWRDARKRFGARPLLQTEDGSMFSIEEAEEILSLLIALLRAKGVGAERPLVVLSSGGAEAILAIWAAWLLGATVAPLDPALPAALLGETIGRLKPALILADISLRQNLPATACVLYLGAETTDPTAASLADELGNHDAVAIDTLTPPDESAIAAILFTSGSTGRPKGVLLSQGSLRRSAQTIADGLGWREGDVLLSPGGLHTMSGLRNPCVAALAAGATVVLPDPRRLAHPVTLAEICRQWQVTVLAAVPALITTVAAAAKTAALRFAPLRQVAVTGSMLSQALEAEGEAAFGASLQVYYGLTETGGVCLLVPPGTTREDDGDVGVPADALLRIVDEAERYMTTGAVGELQIYSANLTAGYLDDSSRSTVLFDRGWLRSGDMARWSSEGHAILCGRKDEQIKNRYGEIVQPAAIEALLCRRDDVAEAVVTGISDGDNMKIFAFVVPKRDGGTQWLAALQAEILRTFGPQQTPDRFVEKAALPRLSSGKVARLALRE